MVATKPELTGTFKIESAFHGLFREAIETLPFDPSYAEVLMAADGISSPGWGEEGFDNQEHISKCNIRGVIPFSGLQFVYHGSEKGFVPQTGSDNRIMPYVAISEQEPAIQGVIKGGRVHYLEFITPERKEFDKFRGTFLSNLLNNDYQLAAGELWIGDKRVGDHESRRSESVGKLVFGRDPDKHESSNEVGLVLTLEKEIPIEVRGETKLWFDKLGKKYGGK